MRAIIIAAAFALSSTAAFAAPALDAHGVCRDHGKFAKGCAPKASAPIICNDGFVWKSTVRQGACSGHKGIKK